MNRRTLAGLLGGATLFVAAACTNGSDNGPETARPVADTQPTTTVAAPAPDVGEQAFLDAVADAATDEGAHISNPDDVLAGAWDLCSLYGDADAHGGHAALSADFVGGVAEAGHSEEFGWAVVAATVAHLCPQHTPTSDPQPEPEPGPESSGGGYTAEEQAVLDGIDHPITDTDPQAVIDAAWWVCDLADAPDYTDFRDGLRDDLIDAITSDLSDQFGADVAEPLVAGAATHLCPA